MSIPTSQELGLLRTQPHYTKLYMSIYQPSVVFMAQVNDADIAKGDRLITYNNVVTGSYSQARIGMTLYVGDAPGGKEKGSIYVYDITGTYVTVGENSHIDWADDDYITVEDFYQIWPIYPRYVQDEENITVYKAHDVTYTDQNEAQGTFICMGSHYAGFLEGGQAQVYFTSEGTENLLGESLTYYWEFEGGTPTGSNAAIPGYVTYTTPGQYTAQLRVVSASGATDRSIRYINIYDKPGEGTNLPIQSWGMESLSGSRDEAGYSASLWVEDSLGDQLRDGALVILFSESSFGATEQSIGGNHTGREGVFFVGYILDGSIEYDYRNSRYNFNVVSPTGIMKLGEAFSVSVEDSTNPIADASSKGLFPWFYLVGLSVKRALHHYIRWHTSLFRCVDFRFTATDKLIQYFDSDRTSIFDALDSLMKSALVGRVVCDRQGTLYFDSDVESIGTAATVLDTCINLDNHDWMNRPVVLEKMSNQVSYLEAGGVAYQGVSGSVVFGSTPYLSCAPGSTPAYRGSIEKITGLALDSQRELDSLVGNVYAYRNARYPEVNIELNGYYPILDIVPKEMVKVTLHQEDNVRGITWEAKPFVIRGVEWVYRPEIASLHPVITLHEVTQGFGGDVIDIPVIPPDDGFSIPAQTPTPNFPNPPSITIITNTTIIGTTGTSGAAPQPLFVPVSYAYDSFNGNEAPKSSLDYRSTYMPDGTSINAYGVFALDRAEPLNTIEIYSVFAHNNQASGKYVYLETSVWWSGNGDPVAGVTGTSQPINQAAYPNPTDLTSGTSAYRYQYDQYTVLNHSSMQIGDIIRILTSRDGTAIADLDNYTGALLFYGWLVYFT